jgi:epimerase transport system membrane fusion protein
MEIVPHGKSLIIEARVSPFDIDRVQIGQVAEARFAVFKDAYLVTGRLNKLSADRLIDKSTNTPYFAAEVVIDEVDFDRLYNGARLVPGMPAEVLIKTGERTFLDYILSPLKRTFSTSLLED